MNEPKKIDLIRDDLMALYDVRIKRREDEMAVITTTFLMFCENHVQEDGFEKDAASILLMLYERKESLKALRKERDAMCGIE